MYLEFHGLKLQPFDNTADPRFLYASEDHREALASIEYTVRMRKGMVLISGEIGAGKTTISRAIQQRLKETTRMVFVREAPRTPRELLHHICRAMDLGVAASADRGSLLAAIEENLLEHHRHHRPVVLLIDEAQMLSPSVLDEVRLLSNIETSTAKLLQIVLVGQPELRQMVQSARMNALRQRIVLGHHLQPLSRADTGNYIRHRLNVAAGDETCRVSFDEDAIDALYGYAHGVPRLINVVADNCLLVAFVRSRHRIDRPVVEAVLQTLVPGGQTEAWEPKLVEHRQAA
jgi:general secretion pathway protein A